MDGIAQVRQFNRTATHQIGALEDRFLGRDRSLGASRVLFEIGTSGIEIRDLRGRLGLDSGYTTRLLKLLEADGLIRIRQSADDARVRVVTLTAKGRRELATLDRLSDEAAASILESLDEKQRTTLLDAMNTVERLLRSSSVTITIEDPSSQTARECLTHYFRELAERFDDGFNLGISISATPGEMTPPNGYFLVARTRGETVGCGALKCHPNVGEIKRMWVATSARGLGIGRRILVQLEELAHQRHLPILRLETNKVLTEAQALYRSNGYREVAPFNSEPYAHHWFEKVISSEIKSPASHQSRRGVK